jgi:hypothetical protein
VLAAVRPRSERGKTATRCAPGEASNTVHDLFRLLLSWLVGGWGGGVLPRGGVAASNSVHDLFRLLLSWLVGGWGGGVLPWGGVAASNSVHDLFRLLLGSVRAAASRQRAPGAGVRQAKASRGAARRAKSQVAGATLVHRGPSYPQISVRHWRADRTPPC